MLSASNQDKLYIALGKRIKEKRSELKLSQSQLALAIGISRPSMVNIELGRQRPPLHLLYSFAQAFKMDVKDILPEKFGEEVPESEALKKQLDNISEDRQRETLSGFIGAARKNYE